MNARLVIVAVVALIVGIFAGYMLASPDSRLRAELDVLQIKHSAALEEIDLLQKMVDAHERQAAEFAKAFEGTK